MMAQRLATEYVKTRLVLTDAEFMQVLQLFQNHNLNFKVKILDNGDHEVVIDEASAEALTLTFERRHGKYVLEGSSRFTDLKLANAMRKAVAQYKGDAIVNRIYEYHRMEYRYSEGKVVRITEISSRGERLVYEYKDSLGEIRNVFMRTDVENRIQSVRGDIDDCLDRRNRSRTESARSVIDRQLAEMAHQLFVLEA